MFKLPTITRLMLPLLVALSTAAPLPVAARPAERVVQQARFCPDGAQSCFGDPTPTPDGGGSEDDFNTYTSLPNFRLWAENSWPVGTTPGAGPRPLRLSDEPVGGNFPFALTGHAAFDPARVRSATLRVDVLYRTVPSSPGSDTVRFWDESDTSGAIAISYGIGTRIAQRFCSPPYYPPTDPRFRPCPSNPTEPIWVSVDLNLKNGTASFFELDPNTGSRVPLTRPDGAGNICTAQVTAGCAWQAGSQALIEWDRGDPSRVLELAADGKLYGLLEDDSALGYVSLFVDADPLPPVCPALLDNFNRRDGPLGSNWSGAEGLRSYRISNHRLDVVGDGPINWVRNIFGASQAACITFVRVDPNGLHMSLMLKVRGNWRQGAVAVFYNALAHEIGVETYIPGRGWELQTTIPNVELHDGDQLAARVRDGAVGGTVDVILNGRKVKETSLHPFFNGKTGRIGLWFIGAGEAVLDDFSGGTITP
jgi:hypothetical protein